MTVSYSSGDKELTLVEGLEHGVGVTVSDRDYGRSAVIIVPRDELVRLLRHFECRCVEAMQFTVKASPNESSVFRGGWTCPVHGEIEFKRVRQ